MRALSYITAFTLAIPAAFAQVPDAASSAPHFEAADVHVSPPSNNQFGRGPSVSGTRYDIHHMTLVDMIVRAYDVTADKVVEGPNWVEYDRFDISAVMPPKTSGADAKLMLKALLADRFQLVVRPDQRPLPSYVLTAPKGKQKMKEAEGTGETGCKFMLNQPPPPPAPGQPFTPPTLTLSYTCRNMTMAAFAEGMNRMTLAQQYIGTNPVQDKTGLEGKWDFNFKYTLPMAIGGGEAITLQSALEKQVGLKLEEITTTLPVIVVEKANRVPTPNEADIAKKIPPLPTEFEVATIKPFEQAPGTPGFMMRMMPGGRFQSSGIPLKMLVQQAWGVQTDSIIGAPKWMDTDSYDIVAKIPAQEGNAPPDTDLLSVMLRALLADRFKLAAHLEDRTMTAYTLTALKPKLKKADPASRTKWTDGGNGLIFFSGSSIPSRTIKFQNMSMAQLAETLQSFAATYIHSPVKDATGLEGGYDFTLTFSLISSTQLATMNARGPVPPPAGGGGDVAAAAEPVSSTTIFEAVEKQLGLKLVEEKRPVSVLVIDHIEQKPTDN